MKQFYSILTLTIINLNLFSQNIVDDKYEDSVLKIINKTTNEKELYKQNFTLAKYFFGKNGVKETSYLDKSIFIAEQTRDRVFIANAIIDITDQYIKLGTQTERIDKALQLIDRTLTVTKESQLNKQTTFLLIRRSYIFRLKSEFANAIKNNEEATNYAEMSGEDTVKVVAELSYANSLLAKDESLGAFKKYMNALNVVETMDDDFLKMIVYNNIADFYASVKQYEKAKDYYQKQINIAKAIKEERYESNAYQHLIYLNAEIKDFTTARQYLNLLKQKANDSKNNLLKSNVLFSEVNLLFSEDESKVAAYIRTNPKIIEDLKNYGLAAEADKGVGIMYSYEKNKDSAEYFFQKAKSSYKPNEPINTIMSWNSTYAAHLQRFGNINGAINLLESNLKMSVGIGSITYQKAFCEGLDSLYVKTGNKEKEVSNKLMLYKLKDSIEGQQKANDLLNIEIDSENKRTERTQKIKEEKLNKKHNLQYMGITAAIFGLFVLLAALGRFKVKPWLIRGIGFLSFILLFEFIILLADTQIHHLTHGEPLPILLIKIVLIAILLPLHHWIEHKAVHYLLRHQNN